MNIDRKDNWHKIRCNQDDKKRLITQIRLNEYLGDRYDSTYSNLNPKSPFNKGTLLIKELNNE